MLCNAGYQKFITANEVKLNKRLSRTVGRYNLDTQLIEVADWYFNNWSEHDIIRVLIHELIHNIQHNKYGEENFLVAAGHNKEFYEMADLVSSTTDYKIDWCIRKSR